MINIFIGFDEGEKAAYYTLCESIRQHSSSPIRITPLDLSSIKTYFWRDKVPNQSTDFAFNRFIIPFLMGYKDWALFMDCDMLMRADISELWEMRKDRYAVQVCKHDYVPNPSIKFRGAKNEPFLKKNWSSFMLMNCKRCKALTREYVSTATGLELHQFKWLESENLIGDIPLEWNWLVGEYDVIDNPKNLHYTLGGPWFRDFRNCDYSGEWFDVFKKTKEIEL